MNSFDEDRAKATQVLKLDGYDVIEYGGSLLASKYCERTPGSVMCLLLEVNPPYDTAIPWGGTKYSYEDSLGQLIKLVNTNLRKSRKSHLNSLR